MLLFFYFFGLLSMITPQIQAVEDQQEWTNQIKNATKTKIIYDATEYIDKVLSANDSATSYDIINKYQLVQSPYVYYKMKPLNFSTIPSNVAKLIEEEAFDLYPVVELALIFRNNFSNILESLLSPNASSATNPVALLASVPDIKQSCLYFCAEMQLNYIPICCGTDNGSIRGGLEVNGRLMECIKDTCPSVLKQISFLLLNVQISSLVKILSLELFEKEGNALVEKGAFVSDFNPDCPFVLRFSLNEIPLVTNENKDMYSAYLDSFAHDWVKEQQQAFIIMDAYPSSVKNQVTSSKKMRNAIPYTGINPEWWRGDNDSVRDLENLLHITKSVFENVVLDWKSGSPYVPLTLPGYGNRYAHLVTYSDGPLPNIILTGLSEKNMLKVVDTVLNYSTALTIKTAYVQPPISSNFYILRNLLITKNISVGCHHDEHFFRVNESSGTISTETPSFDKLELFANCDEMLSKEPLLLLEWGATIQVYNMDFLERQLNEILEKQKSFLEKYPNGLVTVYLDAAPDLGMKTRANIFCTLYLTASANFYDIVVNWAHIHNIKLILKPLLEETSISGYWSNVVPGRGLTPTLANFSLLVHRNGAKAEEHLFPFTYPCIPYISSLSDISNNFTKFDKNVLSGITVNLTMPGSKQLSPQEIQTLLGFAFGRFSTVEITGESNNIYRISNALTPNLAQVFPPNLKMYVEVADANMFEYILTSTIKSAFSPSGLHIFGWKKSGLKESLLRKLEKHFDNVTHLLPVQIGITVQNCVNEIDLGLLELKSFIGFLSPYIPYLVCVVPTSSPKLGRKLPIQTYLDTLFYIQQYFKAELKVDTYFRLVFQSNSTRRMKVDITNYIKWMAQLNHHSEIYKIRYFMGEAFVGPDDASSWSWWSLDDYRNLANESAYTELESDVFGRQTEQKYKATPVFEDKAYVDVTASQTMGLLFLIAAIFRLWIYYLRAKDKFLTKKEVDDFRQGVKIPETEVGAKMENDPWKYSIRALRYNEEFEIPKSEIHLLSEIGKGNFGVVHKAVMKNDKIVAAKMPKLNCEKEVFKTMLDEIKILCYIGSHKNVVSFVGAYTKEIRKGIVYVITEYCGNGSLETHLKTLRQQVELQEIADNAGDNGYVPNSGIHLKTMSIKVSVDQNVLRRFGFEIASGMKYITGKNIIHSDLSVRNVLLDASMTCKIGDFGLSRQLNQSDVYIKKGQDKMPWKWMPPESIIQRKFTTKSDVWGFGVTLWEIYSLGETPYNDIPITPKFPKQILRGMRLSHPKHAPENIYKKMLDCWNISAEKRPTFTELSTFFLHLR